MGAAEKQVKMDAALRFIIENGASLIVNPPVLNRIGEILGRNYFILPSSVHETMIIPDHGQNAKALRDMVKRINETEVPENERLCDEAFYYDTGSGRIFSTAQYLAYQKRKEKKIKNDLILNAFLRKDV